MLMACCPSVTGKKLKVRFYHSSIYQLYNHQIIKNDQCFQIKSSSNCPTNQPFLYLLALKIGAFPHLAEDLKLHHELDAGSRPHPHAAIFAASGKVFLVRAEHCSVHLASREKNPEEKKRIKPFNTKHSNYSPLLYYTLTSNVCRFLMSPVSTQMHQIN